MSKKPFTYMPSEVLDYIDWKEDISVVDYCLENINLTKLASPPKPGWINFDDTPWIEEILNDYNKPWVAEYNILASTQVGKTTIQLCCLSYELDTNQGQILFILPTDDMVSDYVSSKFDPFVIDSNESIQKKIIKRKDEEKKRLKGAVKEIPNGVVFILGNTAKNRRAKSVTRVFVDEASLFGSGHLDEILGRMKFSETFVETKAVIVSSIKTPEDEMLVQYNSSYCKKELKIQCKSCQKHFYPCSEHFKYLTLEQYKKENNLDEVENINDYKREAKDTGHLKCDCGEKITFEDIKEGIRQKTTKLITIEGKESDTIYGYKLNALATGLTKYSTIVEKLIKAGSDTLKLNTIYQDYFNEIFTKDDKTMQDGDVLLLANDYEEFEIPEDTIGLYMGIDSQKGYYWVTIVAIEYNLIQNLVWAGRVEDEDTIKQLFERDYFYQDGSLYHDGVRRVYHDWQGYREKATQEHVNKDTGEVMEDLVMDMPQRVKIFGYNMAKEHGEVGGKERYYLVQGVRTKNAIRSFSPKVLNLEIDGYKDTRKLKSLAIEKTVTTSSFLSAMGRAIVKRKGGEEAEELYESDKRLFFINKTAIETLKSRKKAVSKDLDKQLTSQIWGLHKSQAGVLDKELSFKTKKGRDEHYVDCISYIQVSIDMDNLSSVGKPNRDTDGEDEVKQLMAMFS